MNENPQSKTGFNKSHFLGHVVAVLCRVGQHGFLRGKLPTAVGTVPLPGWPLATLLQVGLGGRITE